ncbi:MAG: malate/lactate/ureidoglycolate dehydrogenase, partial [Ramlibacter sp.]
MAARVIPAPELRQRCERILLAAGSQPEEACTVAANLVLANLSGHDSHGVGMLPRYVDAVLEGGLSPNTGVRVVLDTGTLLALDGQRGYGQVVGEQSMRLGIERARAHGSCIMTLAYAHHLGRIGHWAEMAVQAGLVSLHFVNVAANPAVAPWGGADGRFGTNPCCIGIPVAGQPPFLLDFATSRVAQGKMRVAHNEGRAVDPGYVIDPDGQPTTDPGVVVVPQTPGQRGNLFGALLTFGEHKGYGLAAA